MTKGGTIRKHTFQPLERPQSQIRLLYVLPGDDNDHIRLELSSWNLETAPAFNAISYTWSLPSEDDPNIFIDGCMQKVRKNCHIALFQTRLHHAGEYAWNDAICINQDNNDEKSFQVAMMGDIYARAALVLISLGPDADNSEFVAHGGTGDQAQWENMSNDEQYNWLTSLHSSQDRYGRHREAVDSLMSRPYWRRVWILQEVAMAKSKVVLCGSSRLQWDTVFYTVSRGRGFNVGRLGVGTLDVRPNSLPLEELMRRFSRYGCADARDRIFGINRLVEWPNDLERITPNYRLSNFQLVAQAVPFFSTAEMNTLLSSLNINMYDPTVLDLLLKRNTSDISRDGLKAAPANARSLRFSVSAPVRIIADAPQRLILRNRSSYKSVERAAAQDDDMIRTLDAAQESSFLAANAPKKLWIGCLVAAILCHNAKPGDFLTHYRLWNTQYNTSLPGLKGDSALPGLVIRRRKESPHVFDIIGQAIRLPSFDYKSFPNHGARHFVITFDSNLSYEDLLVLMAQDVAPKTLHGYDPEACIRRLTVDVTDRSINSKPTLRIESIRYKPNNLAQKWLNDFPNEWNIDDPRMMFFEKPVHGERPC